MAKYADSIIVTNPNRGTLLRKSIAWYFAIGILCSYEQRIWAGILPSWQPRESGMHSEPIGSLKQTTVKTVGGEASAIGKDLGAKVGWWHVNLFGRNPGLFLVFNVAGSYGEVGTSVSAADGRGSSDSNVVFRRYYSDLGLVFYGGFFRWEAVGSYGSLFYRDDKLPPVQAIIGVNKFDMLIYKWFSFGLHSRARHVYEKDFESPRAVEVDNRAQFRFEFDHKKHYLEVAGGLTRAQESLQDAIVAEGDVGYYLTKLKITARSYHIFARIKYFANTTDADLGRFATIRLPQDDLHMPPQLVSPEDTMVISLALNQPFGPYFGIGPAQVGYWFNTAIFNYSRRDGASQHTNRDLGIGFYYQFER